MTQLHETEFADECFKEGPQSAMEKMLLEEFLHGKGHSLADLNKLPKAQAKALMSEACQYASLRLAQVESTAHFREKIRGPA
jgi:hypothetical protein